MENQKRMQKSIGPECHQLLQRHDVKGQTSTDTINIEIIFLHTSKQRRIYFPNLPTLQVRLPCLRSGHLFYVFPHTSCRQLC